MKKEKKLERKKTNRGTKKKQQTSTIMYYGLMMIAYLYLSIACIYKYFKYDGLDQCFLELMLILVLSLVIEYVHIIRNDGKNIRKKLSKKKKKERLKTYITEGCILSLTVTCILFLAISSDKIFINFYDFLFGNIMITIILSTVLSFAVIFALSFLGNYLISEKLLRNVNEK